jgi:hypothetical protein
MFKKTIENTSPKRQRVNESQCAHSLALRVCKGAEHGAVQLGSNRKRSRSMIQLNPMVAQM